MPVFASPGTIELELLPRNVMRVDRHLASISVVTQDQQLGAIAAHLDGFRNNLRRADTLDHCVCTMPASQLLHALKALLGRPQLFDVQALGSSKPSCGFQPFLRATNHNHTARSVIKRYRQGRQANRTRSLHHDDVTPIQPHAFDAVDRCDQRAPSADDSLSRELVIQLEYCRTRAKINELCIASIAMRWLVAVVRDAISLPVETTSRLTFFLAVKAVTAG